jgi:thiol-disulfide isomerase/thioredoxin
MMKAFRTALPLTVLLLASALPHAALPAEPRLAPAFDLPRLDGKGAIALQDLRGLIVYVDFWASWCGPCRQSLPLYEEMYQRLPPGRFRVVAINLDEYREDAEDFLRRYPVTYNIVHDPAGGSAQTWGIKAMPTSFLVDEGGRVVAEWIGFQPSHVQELENEIRALLD